MSVDDRVAVVALIEGEPSVRAATVVHRDQTTVHISTDDPLALPVGNVVGLMTHRSDATSSEGRDGRVGSTVALALVAESVGPNITALRVLERRA
jgi:hypothetical protein